MLQNQPTNGFMTSNLTFPTVLSIAGSDCSGGAGIQADTKTISALGAYAATAITAITIQDTLGVKEIHPVPADVVAGQIEAVMNDLDPMAVKIGMVGNGEVARAIAGTIGRWRNEGRAVVYDPVMASTYGERLMDGGALEVIKKELMGMCTLITPNLREAEVLTGRPFGTLEEMERNIACLRQWGEYAVLLKGGHLEGKEMTDLLLMPGEERPRAYRAYQIVSRNTHGTGCTLSSAIATYCALGHELPEAVGLAKVYVTEAIDQGRDIYIGKGNGPLNHFWRRRKGVPEG